MDNQDKTLIQEMTNVEICANISDFILVAERPVAVNGEIYKERSGNVNMPVEMRDILLEAMARLHCRNVRFGDYDCYEKTMFDSCVDGCLVGEINRLNHEGIKTIGCCCGHGQIQGYIQVAPEYCKAMINKGYEQLPIDNNGDGLWCFKPKTKLPSNLIKL